MNAHLPSTMANQIKQYFLAPSWDYPPNGSIALGNIIVSPTRPVPAVVAATSAAGSEGLNISSTKHGVEWQKGKTNAHKFGIWTKLLVASSLLPFPSSSRSPRAGNALAAVSYAPRWFRALLYVQASCIKPDYPLLLGLLTFQQRRISRCQRGDRRIFGL